MQKNKAKLTLFAILTFVCTLIIGGLAFAVPNLFASAAILPDRFDPDRFTAIQFPELKEPDAQKYYGNGYFVVQDMVFKTLGHADSETSGIYNTIYNNRVDKTGSGIGNDASYYTIGSTTTEFNLDGYQIIMEGGSSVVTRSNQIQYLKFTLAKEGKISFTYKVSSEATYDHFYLVVDGILDLEKSGEVVGTYEKTLSAGVHEVAFAYMRDNGTRVGSDSVLITNLEFGEGPQNGIYKDSGLEWAAEKGNKIVEENLELICNAYYDASGNYRWVLDNGEQYKTFPMSITGTAGSYTLTSARMINYEDYGEVYDEATGNYYYTLPISLVEIPFTLSSAQTISFNYELYSEGNFDFLLVFIDDTYVFGLSGEYTDSFTSSTLSAGNHTIMIAVVKDGSVDYWYENGYSFEAQITNLNITSSVELSTIASYNNINYSYKGKISAITNYDIYDVFASCYHTEGDPAQNVYDTTGINYGGEAGIYSDANATNFVNTSGYYFKTIHDAANYFNSIQTASTTFNMVILDDIEVENEATFNNANVATFNIYTDDNDTLRMETNPYVIKNTAGGSILDIETSTVTINAVVPLRFVNCDNYAIKFNENATQSGITNNLVGNIMFESKFSNILLNNEKVNIKDATIKAVNTKTSFGGEYLLDLNGDGSAIYFYYSSPIINLTRVGFASIESGFIYFVATGNIQYTSNGSGLDHDVYIEGTKDYGSFISDTGGTITERLKIKYSDSAFQTYANNYSQTLGTRWSYAGCRSLMEFVEYYAQTEEIGGYALREVLEPSEGGGQIYNLYLLENIGVVFNQNIPEATILGETIRERNDEGNLDTSPSTTISVPYGFEIKSDAEYIQSNEELDKPSEEDGTVNYVPSYDVYGYKKLGWSNNTTLNSFTVYNHSVSHLLDTEEDDIKITHAYVGGSTNSDGNNIDNYGYDETSEAHNVTLEDGTIQRYIYYYSKWYQFLGDSILYSDTSTADVSEGTSVIPIYYAEELVYLSTILSLEKVTAYKGSEIQTFNNSSYAVMDNLNITNYTGYGTDSATGDGKWTYSASSTVKSYSPMCLTEDTAFTGTYFVGASLTSDETNGIYAKESIEDGNIQKKQITLLNNNLSATTNSLGGLFGYVGRVGADESSHILSNIQSIEMVYDNSSIVWADNNLFVGGMVGILIGKIKNCGVQNVDISGAGLTAWGIDGATGGVVGQIGISRETPIDGLALSGITAQGVTIQGNNNVTSNSVGDVGGIVGLSFGTNNTFTNIRLDSATIGTEKYSNTNPSFNSIGGVVGYSAGGTFKDIEIKGIQIAGYVQVGGVVGGGEGLSIGDADSAEDYDIRVINAGTSVLTSKIIGNDLVGGIIGNQTILGTDARGTINKCQNGAEVECKATKGGGIAGASHANIYNCSNNATVRGSNASNIGGIVGTIDNSGGIDSCTNSGSIYAGTSDYVGGIIGRMIDITSDGVTCSITSCSNDGYVAGKNYVGGMAGSVEGFSENWLIEVSSCEQNNTISGNSQVGGIVGKIAYGNIIECSTNENQLNASYYIGGIAGYATNSLTITDCNNYMYTEEAQQYLGGIIGYAQNAAISSCYNYASLHADYDDPTEREEYYDMYGEYVRDWKDLYVGGIVGYITGGNISSCSNEGSISGYGSSMGGMSGYSGASMYSCSNLGPVSAQSSDGLSDKIGGIVGYISNSAELEECSNSAAISSYGTNLGGIAGYTYSIGEMINCDNSGTVTGNNATNVGGIVGTASYSSQIYDCDNATSATITNSGSYTGGIVGYSISTNITYSYNSAKINSTGSGIACGGIAGSVSSVTIAGCQNTSDATITSYGSATGGIVGSMNKSTITNYDGTSTINRGAVTSNSSNIGGIAGNAYGSSVIDGTSSYKVSNYGAVYGHSNIGGIVGQLNKSTVTYGYNAAHITNNLEGANAKYVGGIVGYSHSTSTISNCTNASISRTESSGSRPNYQPLSNLSVWGREYTGGILGYGANTTLSNNTNNGNVQGGWYYNSQGYYTMGFATGGVAGYITSASSAATNNNYGDVKGNQDVGGVIGHIEGAEDAMITVSSSYNRSGASVTGLSETTGGVFGCATYATITTAYNYQGVSGKKYTGGIVGYSWYSTFRSMYLYTSGTISGADYTGGILGAGEGGYIAAAYTGSSSYSPTVSGHSYVGGIVGYIYGNAYRSKNIVSECYNYSRVKGEPYTAERAHVGGIVGYFRYGTVSNCTNYKTITGRTNVGGIIGTAYEADIEECSLPGGAYVAAFYGDAGGIVGRAKSGANSVVQIESCTVGGNASKYSFISARGGAAGGVLGTASDGSTGVIIKSNTISYTQMRATGYAGGVVGYLLTSWSNTKCIASNTLNNVPIVYGYDCNINNANIAKVAGYIDVNDSSTYIDISTHSFTSAFRVVNDKSFDDVWIEINGAY